MGMKRRLKERAKKVKRLTDEDDGEADEMNRVSSIV